MTARVNQQLFQRKMYQHVCALGAYMPGPTPLNTCSCSPPMYPSGIRPNAAWFSIVHIVLYLTPWLLCPVARIRISAYSNWIALFLLWISLPHSTSFAQILDMTGKISSRGQSCGKKPILNFLRSNKVHQWETCRGVEVRKIQKGTVACVTCMTRNPIQYNLMSDCNDDPLCYAIFHLQIHVLTLSGLSRGHCLQLLAAKWELPMTCSRSCLRSRLPGVDLNEWDPPFLGFMVLRASVSSYRPTIFYIKSYSNYLYRYHHHLNLICIYIYINTQIDASYLRTKFWYMAKGHP